MPLSINTSYSAASAAMLGIQTVQNNIANANTEGYARERLQLSEIAAGGSEGLLAQMGSGVMPTGVQRIKDDFLIQQDRDQKSEVSYQNGLKDSLSDIEVIFNENSDNSISNNLSKFFSAWEEASKYPEDTAYRQTLLGQAQQMAGTFNDISAKMNDLKGLVDNKLTSNVSQANLLLDKIAAINDKIGRVSTDAPNALLDERDQYIDQLTQFANIDVENTPGNGVNIRSNGILLISGVKANHISANFDSSTSQWNLEANGSELKPSKGEIASELEIRNQYIPSYLGKLDNFVTTFVNQVNTYHSAGYGLDGSTGNNFFQGTTASTIQVDPSVANSPQSIALASIPGTSGNSDQAKLIAGIGDELLFNGGTTSTTQYYGQFEFQMASDLNSATTNQQIHEKIGLGISEERQNVQGVNNDEEFVNLMNYQNYYQANAKAIKTVATLHDMLMGIMN